jgi:hypothetical protein
MKQSTRVFKTLEKFPDGATAGELALDANLLRFFTPDEYPNPAISIGRLLGKESKTGKVYKRSNKWYLEGTGPGPISDEKGGAIVPSNSGQPTVVKSDEEFNQFLRNEYGWTGISTSVQFFPLNHNNVMGINVVRIDEQDQEETDPVPAFTTTVFMIVPSDAAIPQLHPGQRVYSNIDLLEIQYVDRQEGKMTDTITIPDYSVLVVAPMN